MHVDEISVWSWVAASAFAMTALAAAQDKMNPSGAPEMPFAQPAIVPPALTTDGRA